MCIEWMAYCIYNSSIKSSVNQYLCISELIFGETEGKFDFLIFVNL